MPVEPVHSKITEPAVRWLAGIIIAILITAASAYGAWVNTSITQLNIAKQNLQFHVSIIDAKIDLLLRERGLKYNGPEYSEPPQQ
jgi:hypothetical protein